jgi:hypothetical protein
VSVLIWSMFLLLVDFYFLLGNSCFSYVFFFLFSLFLVLFECLYGVIRIDVCFMESYDFLFIAFRRIFVLWLVRHMCRGKR